MALQGKKLIVRIDDIGYTPTYDEGAFRTFDEGIATAADVMMDSPDTENALRRLRDYPWVSVGWHGHHFWGKPVLGAARVPTLVDPETGKFRHDIMRSQEVSYDEIYAELNEQAVRCIDLLGRAPDTGISIFHPEESPCARAYSEINKKYHIAESFTRNAMGKKVPEFLKKMPPLNISVQPQWEDTKIYMASMISENMSIMEDSIRQFVAHYNPIKAIVEDDFDLDGMEDGGAMCIVFHAGYLDDFMYYDGDYTDGAKNFLLCRLVDLRACISEEVHNWVRDNGVELASFTDALYGKADYQRHLRDIGSDLCMK